MTRYVIFDAVSGATTNCDSAAECLRLMQERDLWIAVMHFGRSGQTFVDRDGIKRLADHESSNGPDGSEESNNVRER